MDIVRIEKVNLVDAVYTQLRELFVSGKWPEGTKIPSENELCRQFSVSRVVIREALQKLRGEKLIVTRHGVGTYVANPSNFEPAIRVFDLSERTYRDFLNFREAVEISAIKLTRRAATEEDYAQIEQCESTMEEARGRNDQYSLADYHFHLAIVSAGHNEMLIRSMAANKGALIGIFMAMNDLSGAKDFAGTIHRQILEDLRAKKIKKVIEDYAEMSRYNLARLQNLFAQSQS